MLELSKLPAKNIAMLVVLVLSLQSTIALARDGQHAPILKQQVDSIEAAVPTGWEIHASTLGDLNGDGRPDCMLVLAREADTSSDDGSVFALYLARKAGGYDLAVVTRSPISLDGTKVSSTVRKKIYSLTKIYMIGGAEVTETYRFRFQNQQLYLAGTDYTARHQGYYVFESLNYLTGELRFRSNYEDKDHLGWVKGRFTPRLLTPQEISEAGDDLISHELCARDKSLC